MTTSLDITPSQSAHPDDNQPGHWTDPHILLPEDQRHLLDDHDKYVHRWHSILVLLIEKELRRLICFCWLKALGIDNILGFDWLASPAPEAMIRPLEVLYALGVLDEDAKLTSPIGFQVSEIPLITCPIGKKCMIVSRSDEIGDNDLIGQINDRSSRRRTSTDQRQHSSLLTGQISDRPCLSLNSNRFATDTTVLTGLQLATYVFLLLFSDRRLSQVCR
ncbi:hypothetical protein Scep_001541 [Stephania cephalantha]|uniref:Helicase associated domain-containing protein n=1 Tax=Stephania cephalantha TaxID=152367 RepID=A0AAP0LAZ7_9MAGN